MTTNVLVSAELLRVAVETISLKLGGIYAVGCANRIGLTQRSFALLSL